VENVFSGLYCEWFRRWDKLDKLDKLIDRAWALSLFVFAVCLGKACDSSDNTIMINRIESL